MRIVFIGAVQFSLACLESILKNHGHVVGVVTLPLHARGRHSDFADLAPLAELHNIPLIRSEKINDPHVIGQIRELSPDVMFVFGFSQLIGAELRVIPPQGCIGTHPALLPRHRGRHPLIWTLVEGLTESGLTFFYLDEGVDSGDILWQGSFTISESDDASSLYRKVTELAVRAIESFLPQLESGDALRVAQDHSRASYWRKRSERDGEIDWQKSSGEIYNLVRALASPYPGAQTHVNGQKVTVWKCRMTETGGDVSAVCGEVCRKTNDGILVKTGSGVLEVTEWQCPVELTCGQRLNGEVT